MPSREQGLVKGQIALEVPVNGPLGGTTSVLEFPRRGHWREPVFPELLFALGAPAGHIFPEFKFALGALGGQIYPEFEFALGSAPQGLGGSTPSEVGGFHRWRTPGATRGLRGSWASGA